jgi:hypothetical protein
MGDITLTKADYVVADQIIDVLATLTDIQTKNYGAINLPIATLDAQLRKDNRIVAKPDADALKLTPPKLIVDYADETGAYHHVETLLTGTLTLGERSTFGQLVQKPSELLWNMGLVAAKGQFVFVFVFVWALIVLWTYKQFQFLEQAFGSGGIASAGPPYPAETYGLIGQWVMFLLYYVYYYVQIPSKLIGIMFGATEPPYGWLVKVLFSIGSALAPVAGFFFQFLIWFTAVQSIPSTPAKSNA